MAPTTSLLPLASIVASTLGFSLQALLVKTITTTSNIGTFQIVTIRGTMQGLGCLAMLVCTGVPAREWFGALPIQRRMLCLRSFLGYVGIAGGFMGISLLPLGEASSLAQTSSLWASLMAMCCLGEPWHPAELLCAVVALCGVVIILRPPALFDLVEGGAVHPPVDLEAHSLHMFGALCSLVSATAAGGVFVVVRWLGTVVKTHTPTVIIYQSVGQVLLAPVCVIITGQGWHLPTPWQWVAMCAIGFLGFGSQLLLTYGLQREKSATATPFRMFDVLFAFTWQLTLVPDGRQGVAVTSIAGAGLIISSMVVNVWAKMRRSRTEGHVGERVLKGPPAELLPARDEEAATAAGALDGRECTTDIESGHQESRNPNADVTARLGATAYNPTRVLKRGRGGGRTAKGRARYTQLQAVAGEDHAGLGKKELGQDDGTPHETSDGSSRPDSPKEGRVSQMRDGPEHSPGSSRCH
mmetsp:Transcript_11342/g.30656  ORF Transcript_11342/g.30656 Transcript_11342/m.30656 type:complete len:468 (+) Transcript_11342:28-1431(+)|eukprot:CAMPEP_0185174650 /NCGR_PEP_ID=MMETSP1139-20130426/25588_1 /TAXON_ID=298111 /ORGANISM="Pavlova sp., Strain CCMP459" /LENGTH=467 /DNA_ID=CAMNT_0027740371 /DNA_START=1 /DNA_END=1407 /DNA_ORIENTATION=+